MPENKQFGNLDPDTYPILCKLSTVGDAPRIIGEFLGWYGHQGGELTDGIENLINQYFGINQGELEAERQLLLENPTAPAQPDPSCDLVQYTVNGVIGCTVSMGDIRDLLVPDPADDVWRVMPNGVHSGQCFLTYKVDATDKLEARAAFVAAIEDKLHEAELVFHSVDAQLS